MKPFEIKKHVLPTPEQAYSQLVGNAKDRQVVEIPIELIDEIENQPTLIHEDRIDAIAESMKVVGQIDPVIVINNVEQEGRYLLLAGRHRIRACANLGLKTVKAIVSQEKDKDKQRLILVASNNDRNTDYLPSERAFSYLEQKQLLEKLGSRSVTSKIAEDLGTNRKSVHKFIQLTNLTKPLLYRVDKGELTVGAGYELSYLPETEQSKVNIFLVNNPQCHINKDMAQLIRQNPDDIESIVFGANDVDATSSSSEKKEPKQTKPKAEPDETDKVFIGFCLADYHKEITRLIISRFISTDDVINYLKQNNRYTCFTRFSESVPSMCSKYKNVRYIGDYNKDKFKFAVAGAEYTLTLRQVDAYIRHYLSVYVPKSEIIKIIQDDKDRI